MLFVIKLLGCFQASYDDVPLKFATDHARALLAYLSVEANTPHSRSKLAALLWPDERESVARHNLRQALSFLKKALHTVPQRDQILIVTSTSVQWINQNVLVDLHHFYHLRDLCHRHPHVDTDIHHCEICLSHLSEAATLYQGEFMDGFALKRGQPFEEWAVLIREQAHSQVLEMLAALTASCMSRGAYDEAQRYAVRHVTLEPWQEDAHRQLMRAYAAQGQTSAALRQYERCRDVLSTELGVSPSAETTRLYEFIRSGQPVSGLAGSTPRPASPSAESTRLPKRWHNLPTYLAPLIGRTQQLQQLRSLLSDPTHRLVTIVGMGGIGKTRLALGLMAQLVAESPQTFTHGVWFVPLVSVTASATELPTALAGAIIHTLGIQLHGQADLPTILHQHLAERYMMLILDNTEHLLQPEDSATALAEFLLTLLQIAPKLTLLLTSRTPVQLLAEQVFHLQGLSIPAKSINWDKNVFTHDTSVHLFAQHAQRTFPSFQLTDENLRVITEVCALLGGVPLAIELAASLVTHFTPPELLLAIRQNLTVLTSTRRDIDARHRRFTTVLDSSWQLLSEHEAYVLTQCALFIGPFSRAAAQAVTEATPIELSGLLDKSLLQQGAVGIYSLHELLRQFAKQKLMQLDQLTMEALHARYVKYYLGLIASHNTLLRQRSAQMAVEQLHLTGENCRHAWEIALEYRWFEPLQAAIDALERYWDLTGRHHEGTKILITTIAALEPIANEPATRRQAQGILARLWLAYAQCLLGQEQFQASISALETAISLAKDINDNVCHARALALCSAGLSQQNRHSEAYHVAKRAYEYDVWDAQIHALITLSNHEPNVQGHIATVVQALQIAQQHDDPYLILLCTNQIAGSYENEGYFVASLPYRAQALQLAYDFNAYQIGEAEYCFGLVHAHLGLYDIAIKQFERTLSIAHEYGFDWMERRALNRCARTYYLMRQLDTAYRYSQQVQAKCRQDPEPPHFFDFTYAQILVGLARWHEAETILQQLLNRKRKVGPTLNPTLLPELAELARLALWQNNQTQALRYVEDILEIVRLHPRIFMPELYFDAFATDVACCEVLHALRDPRVKDVLAASHHRLSAQLAQIADPALRQSYMDNVPANRELRQLYLRASQTPEPISPELEDRLLTGGDFTVRTPALRRQVMNQDNTGNSLAAYPTYTDCCS